MMLQGGASLQFSMVPMNLLAPGTTADYIDTGSWGEKAIKEAKESGGRQCCGLHEGRQLSRVFPAQSELRLTPAPRTCT